MLTVNSKDLNSVITSFQNKGAVGGGGEKKRGLLINGGFAQGQAHVVGFVYWDKRLWMGFCTGASASGWVSVLGQVPVGEFVYWGKRLWVSMCTGASACGWLFVLAQAPVGGSVNWAKHLWIHAIPLADSESSMSRFP